MGAGLIAEDVCLEGSRLCAPRNQLLLFTDSSGSPLVAHTRVALDEDRAYQRPVKQVTDRAFIAKCHKIYLQILTFGGCKNMLLLIARVKYLSLRCCFMQRKWFSTRCSV